MIERPHRGVQAVCVCMTLGAQGQALDPVGKRVHAEYFAAKILLCFANVCAATPSCTPLDLFGGQGRPMTQAMIDWIRTTQVDSSEQILDIFSANITGDLFSIGDRMAGFAAGVEHRRYQGAFNPDPLRQTGESQDSFAAPVSASYDVSEIYAEIGRRFTLEKKLGFSNEEDEERVLLGLSMLLMLERSRG